MTFPAESKDRILALLLDGLSLRSICAKDGMPATSTVMEWLEKDDDFRNRYARAREQQADLMFEEMADIEDDVLSGELKPDAARVVLWSRQWRAAKLRPKVYGEKIEATHEVGDSITKIVREIIRA